MASTPCADAFLAVLSGRTSPPRDALEARLTALHERASKLAPELAVGATELAAALARGATLAAALVADDAPAVDDDALGEVALAAAARRGDGRAHAWFERRYVRGLDASLAHMKLDAATLDEVRQHVRAKLLLPGDDGAPRLDAYAGTGRLAGLVKVVATRAALDLVRRANAAPAAPEADLIDLPDAAGDPALALLRQRFRQEFRAAFAEAARALEGRERNLLRLHLLGGVSLEQLAAMYGVHRATVVRWLAEARRKLLAATRKGLQARLKVRPEELDSLMGLVTSQLDVSVERLLRTQHDDADG